MSACNNMETPREKFNILANYFSLRPFICLCSKGLLHGRFQVEVFGKGNEQVFGFGPVKIEEGQFSLIVAQHGLDIFVAEIVVGTIHQIRIVDFDGDCHN